MRSLFKLAIISAAMSQSVAMAYTCGVVEKVEPIVPGSGKDKILRTASLSARSWEESPSEFHFFRFDQNGLLAVFTNGYEVESAPRIRLRKDKVKRCQFGDRTNEVGFVGDAKVADKYGVFDAAWRESPWGILYDKEKEIDSNGIKSAVCEDHGCLLSDMSLEACWSRRPVTKTWNRDIGKGLFLLLCGGYCCKFDSSGRMVFAGLFDGCDEGRDYREEVDAAMQESCAHWAKLHGLTCEQAEAGYAEYVNRKKGVEFHRRSCGCIDIIDLTEVVVVEEPESVTCELVQMHVRKIFERIVAFTNVLERESYVYVGLTTKEPPLSIISLKGKDKHVFDELIETTRQNSVWTNGCGKALFLVDGRGDSSPWSHSGLVFDQSGRFIRYGRFEEAEVSRLLRRDEDAVKSTPSHPCGVAVRNFEFYIPKDDED